MYIQKVYSRCKRGRILNRELGEEVLSTNIHKVNILLSNLTLKDIKKEMTLFPLQITYHCPYCS